MVVAVLQGSVRSERMGHRVAKWVIARLKARGRGPCWWMPQRLNYRCWTRCGRRSKAVRMRAMPDCVCGPWRRSMSGRMDSRSSAGVQHSIPPAANLLDYFWRIISTGLRRSSAIRRPFGGVRAAMQLRALLAEVGMSSIPSVQPIPRRVHEALSADGVALTQELAERSDRFFAGELVYDGSEGWPSTARSRQDKR